MLPERSFSGQAWGLREADERLVASLCQRHAVPDLIARLMAARGIGLDEAESFLSPRLRDLLPDPCALKDMQKAAERTARAVMAGETMAIFGDYDVDGATSSALLYETLLAFGAPAPLIHIPDRIREGYGPNAPALLDLGARGAKLIFTVDCGTVAFAPLEAAANAGLEIIVLDHHQGEPDLPRAYAVVNPNRADEAHNPCRTLAAVGVSFLFLIATAKALRAAGWFTADRPEPNLLHWLDLVALGTVCDVMPLTGLNRAFVAQGLRQIASRHRLGLRALADRAGLAEPPNAGHLGFIYGPRINAGGRVAQSDLGVRLLTTRDEAEALALAERLETHNAERKALESLALDEALAQAEAKLAQRPDLPMLLLHAEGWHPGIIGIAAARVKERHNLPTMVVAREAGVGKASCRSIAGVDLGAAVAAAKTRGLLLGGGGHAMAAGFTVADESLPALEVFFATHLAAATAAAQAGRRLWLDGTLSPASINLDLGETLARLGPYGSGHPAPRFWLRDARLLAVDVVGTHHLRLTLGEGELGGRTSPTRLKAMAFRSAEQPLGQALLARRGQCVHLAGTLSLSTWQGTTRAEFHVEDAAAA